MTLSFTMSCTHFQRVNWRKTRWPDSSMINPNGSSASYTQHHVRHVGSTHPTGTDERLNGNLPNPSKRLNIGFTPPDRAPWAPLESRHTPPLMTPPMTPPVTLPLHSFIVYSFIYSAIPLKFLFKILKLYFNLFSSFNEQSLDRWSTIFPPRRRRRKSPPLSFCFEILRTQPPLDDMLRCRWW